MDPKTVILVLALNLIAIGGLLALIGRRMADPGGLHGFSAGSMVFGLAYLLRLTQSPTAPSAWGVVPDAAMIFATLCFATGLRHFSGQSPLGRHRIWAGIALFALVSLAANALWQAVGRHAVLNLTLGACYLMLAQQALAARRREPGPLRMPLMVLAGMVGLLGLMTVARGVVALQVGVEPLFVGLAAQIYYGYGMLVSVVQGPNLLWMIFQRLNAQLERLATHDPLTNLLNRHGLDDALHRHFGGAPARPLTLMQIDIDHFKLINDAHGHAAGDAVLQGVARTLAAHVRTSDFVARLGGEEFLVGFDGGDAEQAMALAQRLRQAVAARRHRAPEGSSLACTVSIGISRSIGQRADWEEALKRADEALYAAKRAGRDCVVGPLSGTPVSHGNAARETASA